MRTRLPAVLALSLLTAPALLAHPGHDEVVVSLGQSQAFAAGFTHPLGGLDHLLAMVAVGLLAVRCSRQGGLAGAGDRAALWLVPGAFLSAMALGGLVALAGIGLPAVEWGIALSVLTFGLLLGIARVPRTAVAAGIVGLFAAFHGHAHVAEMADGAVGTYLAGFLSSTALLHAAGLVAGVALARRVDGKALRWSGAGFAAAGVALMAGLLF